MAVGCAAAVRALHALKSNIDSSQFKAAQLAGVAALTGDQTWLAPRNALYQERRDAVLAGLRLAQLPAQTPAGAMYVWAQVPAGMGSEQFADDLLEQASVSVTPGAIYGVNGEGYFRISLGTATPRVREAMARITEWARARS
jgi:LL-diaminopimelate aminotransferase